MNTHTIYPPRELRSSAPTTFDFDIRSSQINRFGIAMIQLHDELWRITRTTGEVLGYIERFNEDGQPRFRAKRMFSSQRESMPLGEFWDFDDAVCCFRFN